MELKDDICKFIEEELKIDRKDNQAVFLEAALTGTQISVSIISYCPFDKSNLKNGFLKVTGEQLKKAVISALSVKGFGEDELEQEAYNRAQELQALVSKINVNDDITEDSARLFCENIWKMTQLPKCGEENEEIS